MAEYVQLIHDIYKSDPYNFEKCAMEIAKLFLPDIHHEEMTRPWRDGGRDATGLYRIGKDAGAIDVEFALEAKCFASIRPLASRALPDSSPACGTASSASSSQLHIFMSRRTRKWFRTDIRLS